MNFLDHKFKDANLDDEFAKLTTREKAAYGIGEMFGGSLFYFAVLTYSTYFYTDVIGISAALVGSVIVFSRIFDGISDVLTGMLIDRIKSPHGRARMLVFWTTIPLAISLVLVYCCPVGSTGASIAYMIITYNFAVTIMFTINNIPWNALPNLLTRNRSERDQLYSLRIGCSYIAGAIISAATFPLIDAMGGIDVKGNWMIVMSMYAISCVIVNFICVYNCQERVRPDIVSRKHAKFDVPSVLRNIYFYVAIAVPTLYQTMMSASMIVIAYYATYILGNTMLSAFVNTAQSIMIGVVCFICVGLLRKGFKKGNLIKFGCILAVVAQVLIIFFPTNLAMNITAAAIRGIGFGFLAATMYALTGDVIEYGHWRTGHRAEGTTTSASGIGNKLSIILGNGIPTLLLAKAGYDGTLQVQSESALHMISFTYIYYPMIAGIVLFVIMLFSKLDQRADFAIKELQAGRFHPDAKYRKIYEEEERAEAEKNKAA